MIFGSMKRLATLLLLLAACSGWSYRMDVTGDTNAIAYPGDTLQFWAIEISLDPAGVEGRVSSQQFPDYFKWSSDTPALADFVTPGFMALKASGDAMFTVRGPNTSRRVTIQVRTRP